MRNVFIHERDSETETGDEYYMHYCRLFKPGETKADATGGDAFDGCGATVSPKYQHIVYVPKWEDTGISVSKPSYLNYRDELVNGNSVDPNASHYGPFGKHNDSFF
ncbi:MAG: hypothetical protein MJ223_02340 [Mycoplasmoidaceae bacterium]|nr:hypothetical protein [Mycoplasmoidaceae bacterium]